MTPDARRRPARLALVLVPLLALALSACTAEPTPTPTATPTPTVAETAAPTPLPTATPSLEALVVSSCLDLESESMRRNIENHGWELLRENSEVWFYGIEPDGGIDCMWGEKDCRCDNALGVSWLPARAVDPDQAVEAFHSQLENSGGEDVVVIEREGGTQYSMIGDQLFGPDAEGYGDTLIILDDGQMISATNGAIATGVLALFTGDDIE